MRAVSAGFFRFFRAWVLGGVVWIFSASSDPAAAASILAPGDLMIVTVNAVAPKGFDAVPLVPMEEGTVIYFTDNAWSNTAWRASEGLVTYTASVSVAAGTVLSYRGSNVTGFTKSGFFDLSASGDTLLVYQGPATNPAFVFGVGWAQSSSWIISGDPGTGQSYEPEALSEESLALSLGPRDNYQYRAAAGIAGSRAELLQWIGRSSSWTNRDSAGFDTFSPDFSVLSGEVVNPEDFTATPGHRKVSFQWTLSTPGDALMLAFGPASSFGVPSGSYAAGDEIAGGGRVLYNDSGIEYQHIGLTNGQTYYYKAWTVRDSTNYSSGVATSAVPYRPPLPAPEAQAATDVGTNGFTAHWSAVDDATGYLLDAATNGAFHEALPPDGADTLVPGELVLVTVNAGAPKGFDAIPLIALKSNTVIKFSDKVWSNSTWVSSEGLVTFTAPSNIPAGSVLSYRGSNEQGFVKSGSFDLSANGETLLVYQGADSAPSFLYGVGWARATPWVSNGAPDTSQSYVPPELSAQAGTLLSLGRATNYQYGASFGTTGTVGELAVWIGASNRWTGSSTSFPAFVSSLTVTGGWRNDYVPGFHDRPALLTQDAVTGLASSVIYYYRVRATNEEYVGPYSDFTNVQTLAGCGPGGDYAAWAAVHGLDPGSTEGQPSHDFDLDTFSNWEEFIADTDPTNSLAFYPNRVTFFAGGQSGILYTGPPTTNSRRYDLWMTTNIEDQTWICLDQTKPGAGDGSAIFFATTNDLPFGYYRTGVQLPP